jgi:hypothetical protein
MRHIKKMHAGLTSIRIQLIVVIGIAAAALAVPVAQAAPPIITPSPASDFVDTTSCAFPVSVHITLNNETAKIFTSGKVIVTGPLAAQYSANGKTLSLNISGPATITSAADGSTSIVGHGVGVGPVLTPNGVTLGYLAGTVSISTTGPVVLLHGTLLLDLCAALAP